MAPRALVYVGLVTSGDASDWVLNQTYKLTNIIVDVFEYHFQVDELVEVVVGLEADLVIRVMVGMMVKLQNLLPTIVAQVGDQGRGQENGRNQNGDVVNENIRGDVSRGCTYKDFLACDPKEYDVTPEGKRIERYVYGLALQIRGMMAVTKPNTIQKAVQIADTLTDEALRNRSIKKNPKKRGNRGEPSNDRNVRDVKKRTMIGNAFATTTNPVGRENTSTVLKCTTCNIHHPPETSCRTCFNCNRPVHFAKYCRVVESSTRWELSNQVLAKNKGHGRGNQVNQARGRAFMLGAEEARQDPNIVTGTFTLNDHYATTLFDSGADYSFVSTTFIPLLGIEPSYLGMDWLSDNKAEINCHEKVVWIPPLDGKVLRVLGEKPKEKVRQLMSVKDKENNKEEVVVVKDFPEVFPDDLSGLPPVREIKFRIELVPGAMPVAKSPYRLALIAV
nr:hypothetical protein [Tanacetum cinerariifolium]